MLGVWLYLSFARGSGDGRTGVPYSVLRSQVTAGNVTEITIATGNIDANLGSPVYYDAGKDQVVSAAGDGATQTTQLTAERPPNFDDQQLISALTSGAPQRAGRQGQAAEQFQLPCSCSSISCRCCCSSG